MNKQNRRFIFIDFDNLKKVKFKKLEKVCDKIFVFINNNETNVPFQLVQQMQNLGKNVKWIVIDNPPGKDMNYHICFMLGRLHQKVDKSVDFAILSNDKSFDGLITFINDTGRNCLRVMNRKLESQLQEIPEENSEVLESKAFHSYDFSESPDMDIDIDIDDPGIPASEQSMPEFASPDQTLDIKAKETVQRLIRSGNRPVDLSMLKSYILLHNKNLNGQGGIDSIIQRLEETQEIEVHKGEVTYNF